MTELSPESRNFIEELVSSGRFESRQAAIEEAVRRLRQDIESNGEEWSGRLTAEDWCERFEIWAASHRTLRQEAEDSRESVYAGRGE